MKPPVGPILLPGWYHRSTDPLRYAASVDYETDRKVQGTIAAEFGDRTILCIARKSQISLIERESVSL